MPADFIPDGEFVSDSEPATSSPGTSAAAATPDFIPDSNFVSDDEKYGTLSQQAITALEGGARGLTFGGSDVLESKLLHNAQEMKGRAAANPITSTVSQIGGAALPIIATGGGAAPEELAAAAVAKGVAAPAETVLSQASRLSLPYLASRAGQAVEHAAGEGIIGRALGMGAEGAAYGLGNAVSDAALGDPHLTAQKVISDMGMGAAFGAGLGVLSKGIEATLPAATKKLTSSLGNLKEMVFGTEENPSFVTRALSIPGSMASGETTEDWAKAFHMGLEGIEKPKAISELSKNLQQIRESAEVAGEDLYKTAIPENIDKSLKELKATKAPENLGNVIREASNSQEAFDPFTKTKIPGGNEVLSDIPPSKAGFDPFTKQSAIIPEAEQALNQNAPKAALSGLSPEEAKLISQDMLKKLSVPYEEYQLALKNFDQAFTKKGIVDPGRVQSFFNRFTDPSQELKKAVLNDFVDKAHMLAKASENYYGYKAAEESLSGRLSDLAKKHQQLTDIAQVLKSRVSGEPAGRLGEIGAGYAAHALGVPHPVIAAALGTVEAYKAIKNPYELGGTLGRVVNKLKVLGDIMDSANKKMGSLSRSIFIAPEGRSLPVGAVALASDKGYDKKVARIEELANQPNTLMDHLHSTTKELYDAAPNVSEGVHSTLIAAVQFLNSKVPRPANEMVLSPEWEPSRTQKEQFQRYYDAVDNPMSVFKEIKNGTLTNETMDALSAVYPNFLSEMRQNVMGELNPKKAKNLGYGTKIALAKFLGQPLDEAMQPQVLASNQAALQGGNLPPPMPSQKKKKSTLGGLKQLGLASRASTETQEDRDNEV